MVMVDGNLTNEQKLRVAAEVVEGKRDAADLDKYGIAVGERVPISAEEFLQQLEEEKRKQPKSN
jgi:5S rRNA maturation endonuclease (ribonuclease M5)